MFNVNITLYSFDELNEKAKEKAIEDHRNFLLSTMHPTDFISGDPQWDTPEELQKTYDAEYEYYSFEDEPIVDSIEANDYLFFANGNICPSTTYWGNHPKAGTTELQIHGEIIEL